LTIKTEFDKLVHKIALLKTFGECHYEARRAATILCVACRKSHRCLWDCFAEFTLERSERLAM